MDSTGRIESLGRPAQSLTRLARFFGVDSWKAMAWVAGGWAIVVGLFLVQYQTYGVDRYLGWDTSTYVQMARQIQLLGPWTTLTHLDYPSLYGYVDWVIGSVAGNLGVGERVLPVLMGMVLVALYFRLGRETLPEGGIAYAGLAALLAALVPNTMRLLSDLHRNLFALIAGLTALLVLMELMQGRRSRRNALVALVVLSALAAYSEWETYAVLLVTVAVYGAFRIRDRWPAVLATALPMLVASPFMLTYFQLYVQYAAVRDPADPSLSLEDFIYYHGGLLPLLPLAALGAAVLALRARGSHPLPKLLLVWYLSLMALVPALWLYNGNLPPYRPLYLIPVPILLVLGIQGLAAGWPRFLAWVRTRLHKPRERPAGLPSKGRAVVLTTLAVLVILAAGVGMSAQKDVYMQPFISEQLYAELVQVGHALEPYAGSSPILVFYGFNGTWYYSMERAYVGALSGPASAYFGRPQFLLSATDPLVAEPMLSNDPNPSRFVASELYKGFVAGGMSASNAASFPIVVSTPGLYDRPLSDYFVLKHRVSPGLYVVPPGSVTSLDRDTWMWFAAYDWQQLSTFTTASYPWSLSPGVLSYAVQSLAQPWNASFLMDLSQSRTNATLSLHLLDTPAFPGNWNVTPPDAGTFTIYVDGQPLAHYVYGYRGVEWVDYSVGDLTAGYHTVRIVADDLGKPFALALDAVAFCPQETNLSTILPAYRA